MGVNVDTTDGRPPITIHGGSTLRPISYQLPVASAQVKSCVLLAGLGAWGRTHVVERGVRTRDHTERMLEWFGVSVGVGPEHEGVGDHARRRVETSVEGPATLAARDVSVPGDISSAAFFLCAAALLGGSDLTVKGVGPRRLRPHG
jgi:3-phosphoshikimate 1-carboxyvinyltransferase